MKEELEKAINWLMENNYIEQLNTPKGKEYRATNEYKKRFLETCKTKQGIRIISGCMGLLFHKMNKILLEKDDVDEELQDRYSNLIETSAKPIIKPIDPKNLFK